MKLTQIRLFALTKLTWIKQQQQKLEQQSCETKRDYVERESHYVFGERCLLHIVTTQRTPYVEHRPAQLYLHIKPQATRLQKQALLEAWYRTQLQQKIVLLTAKWELLMQVKVQQFFIQRMKTRWGSCNPWRQTIRINSELAKKPLSCLEYIVVHELVHLLEPSHNHRFKKLMQQFLPQWQAQRRLLNEIQFDHEN